MKFYGEIGYGLTSEQKPGAYEDAIVEKLYRGDILNNSRQLQEGEKVNSDLSVGVSISIVADAYASENFYAIRYLRWAGALWTVSNVDVQSPRLILRLGGVYNGPTAPIADTP